MSACTLRQPAWKKYGTDLSIDGNKEKTICNWSASQAGEMLLIWLNRPACEHTGVNAYGGTAVGPKTALCKADYDCPAGLAVNKAMKLASKRFSLENTKKSGHPTDSKHSKECTSCNKTRKSVIG